MQVHLDMCVDLRLDTRVGMCVSRASTYMLPDLDLRSQDIKQACKPNRHFSLVRLYLYRAITIYAIPI